VSEDLLVGLAGAIVLRDSLPGHLGGRVLFGDDATCEYLSDQFSGGATVKATKLTDEFDYEAFVGLHGDQAMPMFAITESGVLRVATADKPLAPRSGQVVVSLFRPVSREAS